MTNSGKLESDIVSSLMSFIRGGHDYSSLESMFDLLPVSIYWKDSSGIYKGRNLFSARNMQALGLEDHIDKNAVLGKTDFDFFDKESARGFREHDEQIMSSGVDEPQVIREDLILAPGKICSQLSAKAPLKDKHGRVIGIIGSTTNEVVIASKVESQKYLKSQLLAAIGSEPEVAIDRIPELLVMHATVQGAGESVQLSSVLRLSKRELQCLFLVAKGNTRKQIAALFNISARTVETHLNRTKEKLSCLYQTELASYFWKVIAAI